MAAGYVNESEEFDLSPASPFECKNTVLLFWIYNYTIIVTLSIIYTLPSNNYSNGPWQAGTSLFQIIQYQYIICLKNKKIYNSDKKSLISIEAL